MSLLSQQDQVELQRLFKDLQNDVSITYFTQRESPLSVPGQECEYCKDTRELLEEVTELSEKLHLEIKDFYRDEQDARRLGIEHIPAFVIHSQEKGHVRFYGIPSGYEFSTLIEDLLTISKGDPELSENTRQALKEVDQDLHIQVFVTPTCPYCPRAASMAHKLAMENSHITADVVEISEFIDLAQRYRVQGVPKIVVNDKVEFTGALPESRFVQQVLQAI